VARIWKRGGTYTILVGNLVHVEYLGYLGREDNIKMDRRQGMGRRRHCTGSGQGKMVDCCERCNIPSGSTGVTCLITLGGCKIYQL